jgi:hypothetical protein
VQEHRVSATPSASNLSADSRLIAGSRVSWRVVRLAEVIAIPIVILFNSGPAYGRVSAIVSVACVFVMLGFFHQSVYGFLERDGLRYKRYLRWRKANWADIESISQPPLKPFVGSIFVDLKNGNLFNRRLSFSPNPTIFGKPTSDATYDNLRDAWLGSISMKTQL